MNTVIEHPWGVADTPEGSSLAKFLPDAILPGDIRSIENATGKATLIWFIAFLISLFLFWPLLLITIPLGFAIAFRNVFGGYLASRQLKGLWRGDCPHCHQDIVVRHDIIAFNCPICMRRVLRENDVFKCL